MARQHRRSTPANWSLIAAAVALAGCEAEPEDHAAAANNVAAPAPALPLPAPEPPLDRERLLLAVAQARSAYAAGEDDRAAQERLDGARFELRIRFGCGAPSGEAAGNPSVRHDPDRRTVEVSAEADISLEQPAVAALAGETVEAAEGLWIPNPWLLRPACLQGPGGAETAAPEVGIVQYFTPDDSRVGRRGERSYRHVIRLGEDQEPARPQGFEMVLTGRLRTGPGERVIGCTASPGARMPVCLIAAEFETVRIEDGASGAEIARWGRG